MRMMYKVGSAKQAAMMLSQVTVRSVSAEPLSGFGSGVRMTGIKNWLIVCLPTPRKLEILARAWADCVRQALAAGSFPMLIYMGPDQRWVCLWSAALLGGCPNSEVQRLDRTMAMSPADWWGLAKCAVDLDLTEPATC